MPARAKGYLIRIYLFIFSTFILSEVAICKRSRLGCYGTDEVCGKCMCSAQNSIVNCSHRRLTKIPHPLPVNLRELDLRRNNISILNSESIDNCLRLHRLNLTTNSISHIPRHFFRNVPITHLHLEKNKLNLVHSPDVLSSLRNTLTSLYIHKNDQIPHTLFNNLHKLSELHIDGHIQDGFGRGFSTLRSLKILTIYTNLTNITNSTFINFEKLTALKTIILKGAGVKRVERGAFKPLKALRTLDFSYNYGFKYSDVELFLNSLSDDLEILLLTNLYDGRESEKVISDEFFKVLSKKRNLKTLKLDRNKLIKISRKLPIYIRSLTHLDVSKNHLHNVTHWPLFFFLLTNLTYVNIDDQDKDPCDPILQESPIPNFAIHPCRAADVVDIPPCLFPTMGLKKSYCVSCPRNLRELHHSNCMKVQDLSLPPIMVFGNCRISKHIYRDNGVRMAIGPIIIFRPTANISTFDFGYNGMTCFAPEILKYSIERGLIIDRLILDGNNLSNQLGNDVDGETFAVYSNLTELNLAYNKLKILHKLTFYNLINLKLLNLSSNFLVSLSFDVSRLENLRKLDLTNNRLVTFESNDVLAFSSLSGRGYGWLKLFIEGNALTCSCEYLTFMDWIAKNDTLIDNFNQITCNYLHVALKLTEVKNVLHNTRVSCYYALPLIISGGLLALLIICTLVGTIVYKYRWDIRYYMVKRSQRMKHYQLLLDGEKDYLYDAFVSYDMNDRSWIVQELISNIEQKPPYTLIKSSATECNAKRKIESEKEKLLVNTKRNYGSTTNHPVGPSTSEEPMSEVENVFLSDVITVEDDDVFRLCIHERDFELGNEIEANILNAIQRSRMVILVVTNDFIKSKWCRLEVEMAKMESLERGRNIVVTVFLEPIQETLESLEWFMKRYTYLEWFKCDTKSEKDKFWKRMKLALEGNNKKIVCQCGGR